MRRVEYLRLGIPALLREVEKSPLTITYRGVSDKDEALYEIKNRKGEVVCLQGTEKQVFEGLVAGQQSENKEI